MEAAAATEIGSSISLAPGRRDESFSNGLWRWGTEQKGSIHNHPEPAMYSTQPIPVLAAILVIRNWSNERGD